MRCEFGRVNYPFLLRWGSISECAQYAVFVGFGDFHLPYLIVEIFAFGVHFHIIGSVADIVVPVRFFKQHGLYRSDECLPIGMAHFCPHGDGGFAPLLLHGVGMLARHFVRRSTGTTGIGENMHIRKAAFLNKGKAFPKFLLRFSGECHNHVRGDGTTGECLIQQTYTFQIKIEGVDLVTEGVITVNKVLEYAKDYLGDNEFYEHWSFKRDGASLISRLLFEEATDINFYVGRAINPAHQNPDLPINFNIKMNLVEELSKALRKMGKRIKVSYF